MKKITRSARSKLVETGTLHRSIVNDQHSIGDLSIAVEVPYVPKIDIPPENFASAFERVRQAMDSFQCSFTAAAFAFGIPDIPPDYDVRIVLLSQQLPLSYQDTASGVYKLAMGLGISVSECLDRIDNKVSNLTELCNCYYAIKHWNAPDRAPLQALTALPDPLV